jgi:hypothetical protein
VGSRLRSGNTTEGFVNNNKKMFMSFENHLLEKEDRKENIEQPR